MHVIISLFLLGLLIVLALLVFKVVVGVVVLIVSMFVLGIKWVSDQLRGNHV